MSVKIYDKKQKKWIIFPGTIGAPGKDAYLIAQENGYTGTKEEYAKVLTDIPKIINSIEEEPTEGSKNLITSGGVWQAIDNVHTTINNQIKSSIVDNLESLAADKSLSANQGRILKEMIANLANLQIEIVDQLPSVGETNIIYLVKKSGSAPDIHDEYVFVDGKWEKIGDTEIDLSNYYTRDEVDDKLTDFGAGDVIAAEAFTTADRVITSNGPGKTVKDSGILINNLALKSYVDEKEIAWDKVTGKPETYVPAAHTHPLAQITDAGALAYKDKVDESDLNFDIPDGTVVDSSLSTSSVNPVQNKVVTEALNNRYTKSETYSQSEIDEKIGSAGSGDVMASGNLAVDYIIIGAGPKSIKNSGQTLSNLALKSEIPSLSGYATQSWVTGQGYLISIPAATSSAYGGIQIGYTTSGKNYAVQLSNGKAYVNVPWTDTNTNYYPTTFTWANGTTAGPTGSLTGSGMSTVSFGAIPSASATQSGVVTTGDQTFGGIKTIDTINVTNINEADPGGGFWIGYNTEGVIHIGKDGDYDFGTSGGTYSGTANTAKRLLNSLQFSNGQSFNGSSAVTIDLPEIPIALPNPYALNVTAGGSTTSYTGSSASTIDLDNIYAKKLPSVDTPGKPGLYFASSGSVNVTEVYVTENNPDAIILVANTVDVTFGENYHKMDGIDSLSGGNYKCYCITYVRGVVLVNGAIYG